MQAISVYDLTQNPFQLIGKQWAMITTRAGDQTNTMTASWGGVGILWGKPVAYLFVRPQRHTRTLLDESELFSVCFLGEEHRAKLNYCGSHSGRDEDKLHACGLSATTLDGAPVLAESELALTCRKLFAQRLDPACLLDPTIAPKWYPNADYHYLYIAEILSAYT